MNNNSNGNFDLTTEEGRILAFLEGSSSMAPVDSDKGHYEAICEAVQKGKDHVPLTQEDFTRWQELITEEKAELRREKPSASLIEAGIVIISASQVQQQFDKFLKDLNSSLIGLGDKNVENPKIIETLANYLYRFQRIHPFNDGNGRVGRILANYIAARCHIPLIVFKSEELDDFNKAHGTIEGLRAFFAKKIHEAVFAYNGSILVQVGSDDLNNWYENQHDGQRLTIQWDHKTRLWH